MRRIAAGFGAFLGHLFPVWLGFKGGKGVATYLGVLLGLVLARRRWPSRSSGCWSPSSAAIPRSPRWSPPSSCRSRFTCMDMPKAAGLLARDEPDRLHQAPRQHLAAAGRNRSRGSGRRDDPAPPPAPQLSDRQRLHWLRLIRTPNVGPASFRDLINRFGSAEAALEMLPELMLARRREQARPHPVGRRSRSGGGSGAQTSARASSASANRTIRRCSSAWTIRRRCWPSRAMPRSSRLPPVAIVGARNASLAGIKMARQLAARARPRRLRRRLRPGPRHRHRGPPGQPRHRHGGGARRRARPALPARKRRPLRRDCRTAAPSFRKCRSAGSRARRTFHAATASLPGWRSGWSWSRRRSARVR